MVYLLMKFFTKNANMAKHGENNVKCGAFLVMRAETLINFFHLNVSPYSTLPQKNAELGPAK